MARRFVERRALCRRTLNAEVMDRRMLEGAEEDLLDLCADALVRAVWRHGKNLFLDLEWGCLHIHVGMRGDLGILGDGERGPHERFRLNLEVGALVLNDPRRFGRFGHVRSVWEFVALKGLGPDALGLSEDDFVRLISVRRGAIKPILLDQRVLAGVGNLYADEALFQARVHPRTPVSALSRSEISKLGRELDEALTRSIALETDFQRLPNGCLLKARNVGGPCPRCGAPLQSETVGGRTSIFCRECQKERAVRTC